MRKFSLSVLTLLAGSTLMSGCGPTLPKLNNCTSDKYRYANPNGVSLPQLDVPTVDEIDGAAPQPPSPPPATPGAAGSADPTTPAKPGSRPAPIAAPPKHGAMLMPASGAIFRSC